MSTHETTLLTFNIGQQVFIARARMKEKWVTCPDCFGRKYLTVILGDDSQVQIDCAGCALGYDPPFGAVKSAEFAAEAEPATIDHIEFRSGKILYNYQDDGNICATREDAIARAVALVAERDIEQAEQLKRKEHQTRTWAWNVTHHRREIKRAEKELIYHKSKLEAAKGTQ